MFALEALLHVNWMKFVLSAVRHRRVCVTAALPVLPFPATSLSKKAISIWASPRLTWLKEGNE